MATHRFPVAVVGQDSGVPLDLVSNQITSAAAPSVGNIRAFVVADGGADEGLYVKFTVPKNYVGTPVLVVRGILDGAPGAADTLGWSVRKRAVANNEVADGTFDVEQTVSATIGSNGTGHGNEDEIEQSVTLTGADYSVDDSVYAYVAIDASGTSYAGNVLIPESDGLFFEYADA